jgi:hypothetical protein
LAQALWHKPFGTSPLAQALWHKPFGTSPLAQVLWYKFFCISSLEQCYFNLTSYHMYWKKLKGDIMLA